MTTPRERRFQKTREAILSNARKMIVDKGYENISLRQIAEKSDFSPSGLYEYFKNKQEIFTEIAFRENLIMSQELDEISPEASTENRLIDMCLYYVEHALSNKEIFKLMNSLTSQRQDLAMPIPDQSPYKVILEAVQTLISEKNILQDPEYASEQITYSLWAMVHGMATLQLSRLEDFDADFKQVDRKSLETFVYGLVIMRT